MYIHIIDALRDYHILDNEQMFFIQFKYLFYSSLHLVKSIGSDAKTVGFGARLACLYVAFGLQFSHL